MVNLPVHSLAQELILVVLGLLLASEVALRMLYLLIVGLFELLEEVLKSLVVALLPILVG